MQLKIYLSSTYEDLAQYRERIYKELRTLRHDVIAMEDYVAADERPLEKCLEDVRGSDVYIGVFAWRYGYVPAKGNPDKKSITELELGEAERHGKPCLVFIVKGSAPWPPTMMDAGTGANDAGARIQALRKALQQDKLVGMFETPDELATKVVGALYRWQMESSTLQPVPAAAPQRTAERAKGRGGNSLLWENGSRLRVRFLDGPQSLQQRILRFVQIWSAYANIGLGPSNDPDAEIRVSFKQPGSWAFEGVRILEVPPGEPTANFGWLTEGSPIDEVESVVLHEFGHILGLAHEHNNPDAGIVWNKDKVRRDLTGPPNSWSAETVENLVFKCWERDRYPLAKPFDPHSIMAFPVPADWTENGFSIGRNLTISSGDKEFVSRLYPYGAPSAPRRARTRVGRRPKPA